MKWDHLQVIEFFRKEMSFFPEAMSKGAEGEWLLAEVRAGRPSQSGITLRRCRSSCPGNRFTCRRCRKSYRCLAELTAPPPPGTGPAITRTGRATNARGRAQSPTAAAPVRELGRLAP